MTATDIPVKYINATGNIDFSVVVLTKNFNLNKPKIYYCAWRILLAQSSVRFIYPVSSSVGATYTQDGQLMKIDPVSAEPGSTWEIQQNPPGSTPVLSEGRCDR